MSNLLTLIDPVQITKIDKRIRFIECNYLNNPKLIELSREFIQRQYFKLGYKGYNPEFDRRFDLNGWSHYAMAVDLDDTILATSRVVMKGPYGIPIQYALREDTGEQIKLGGSNIAEMNSFAATSISAGIQVLLLSAEFIVRRKFDETYGLYDSERPAMGRLYDRLGAKDSVEHSYRIYFPDYGKEKNSKLIPTYWKIQVSDMEKLIANKCH